MDYLRTKIIKILSEDSRTTVQEISEMLTVDVKQIEEIIEELEKEKIILKYTTAVNREKISDYVMALIEVKVTPQKEYGFEVMARKICRYNQVKNLYLISGNYDFMVMIEEEDMKKVAQFVHEKLAVIDGVISTATHFVLKGYKESGIIYDEPDVDCRLVVSP